MRLTFNLVNTKNLDLLTKFLESRRQGISPDTIRYYRSCLKPLVTKYELTPQGINEFLTNLQCGNGKFSYFRAIRAFCNWLHKNELIKDNPIKNIDAPKVKRQVLPSLTEEQVKYLMEQAECYRDKCIIALFADSGMRWRELATIKKSDINWQNNTITIWGKGAKQRKAPFTNNTAKLLRKWITEKDVYNHFWNINADGIRSMLRRLERKTGLPCNPHTFRRTFASNLHRKGLDVEHIMRLGGWESLDMVLRYTRSVKFEDSLKLYQQVT